MHELSIAMEIIRQVVEIARQHNADCVEEVEVQAGVLRQIQEEALQMSFVAAAEGTPAEGARLVFTEEQVVAVCNDCQTRFMPEMDNYLCPRCGLANVRIVAGNDIILKSIVCQSEDEEVGEEAGA
ncbi:MAG TPA: hydrogenase maturation nickel metallochaperone HypA [Phycisphaerae bacterium]|jgi:hydrogenase nickel incorporation protein HypA/HybF|nr:hydrogenase maturation nickel metallochaperone HypA [Phycisphaerae bacterium]HOJ53550.1 hydrogenase maturation nickel metallochaperone HypA [Phycisphaerae bacterium]HOL25293.1 hydrogenase maturation nickel metallochaperone HypA [Phycisphaerae bacterium]HPP20492.1 hydrogenase maturation nickel metallochaperone HypA [Phycisphaerae bacterium]HPU32210.1 hydrogenase maturation nickel metallochaperone HypA [Phycisphaerae bacterium]